MTRQFYVMELEVKIFMSDTLLLSLTTIGVDICVCLTIFRSCVNHTAGVYAVSTCD